MAAGDKGDRTHGLCGRRIAICVPTAILVSLSQGAERFDSADGYSNELTDFGTVLYWPNDIRRKWLFSVYQCRRYY
jgi:hypothetical protein